MTSVKAVKCVASGHVVTLEQAQSLGLVGIMCRVSPEDITKDIVSYGDDQAYIYKVVDHGDGPGMQVRSVGEVGMGYTEDGDGPGLVDFLAWAGIDTVESNDTAVDAADAIRINKLINSLHEDEDKVFETAFDSFCQADEALAWKRKMMNRPFSPLQAAVQLKGKTLESHLHEQYANRKTGKKGRIYGPTLKLVIEFIKTMDRDHGYGVWGLIRQRCWDEYNTECRFNSAGARDLVKLAELVEEGIYRSKKSWGDNSRRLNKAGDQKKAKDFLSRLGKVSTKVRQDKELDSKDKALIEALYNSAGKKMAAMKEDRKFTTTIPLYQIAWCITEVAKLFWETKQGEIANHAQDIYEEHKEAIRDLGAEDLWGRFNRLKYSGAITPYFTNGDTTSVDDPEVVEDERRIIDVLAEVHVHLNRQEEFEDELWTIKMERIYAIKDGQKQARELKLAAEWDAYLDATEGRYQKYLEAGSL